MSTPTETAVPVVSDRGGPTKPTVWTLILGSIGVVYGDIGTSPLYAVRESVLAARSNGQTADEPVILGILSLIVWALILIVTIKYVTILLRADNDGEGGTLALMALAQRAAPTYSIWIVLLGMISAALFYGDAMITPALSVLSAVEGLEVATPAFKSFVVPLTVVILFALFAVQSKGTAKVAAWFGPITLVWFVAIAVVGVSYVAQNPRVLLAVNPTYGISFLAGHGIIGLATLGAVFLVVTGSEALYADLGHFGRLPIRTAQRCSSRSDAQLSRTRCTSARQSGGNQKPVLPPLSRLVTPTNGRPGHGGDDHCQPSSHKWGLLSYQPSDAVGAVAPTTSPPHL
jgi:KUP system potassium uptake protein